MFCPRCFESIADTSAECPACGTSLQPAEAPPSPARRPVVRPGASPSGTFSLGDRLRPGARGAEPARPRSHLSIGARVRQANAPSDAPARLFHEEPPAPRPAPAPAPLPSSLPLPAPTNNAPAPVYGPSSLVDRLRGEAPPVRPAPAPSVEELDLDAVEEVLDTPAPELASEPALAVPAPVPEAPPGLEATLAALAQLPRSVSDTPPPPLTSNDLSLSTLFARLDETLPSEAPAVEAAPAVSEGALSAPAPTPAVVRPQEPETPRSVPPKLPVPPGPPPQTAGSLRDRLRLPPPAPPKPPPGSRVLPGPAPKVPAPAAVRPAQVAPAEATAPAGPLSLQAAPPLDTAAMAFASLEAHALHAPAPPAVDVPAPSAPEILAYEEQAEIPAADAPAVEAPPAATWETLAALPRAGEAALTEVSPSSGLLLAELLGQPLPEPRPVRELSGEVMVLDDDAIVEEVPAPAPPPPIVFAPASTPTPPAFAPVVALRAIEPPPSEFPDAASLVAAMPHYFDAGRYPEAFEQIERLVELAPEPGHRARCYYEIANELFARGELDPALELWNEALTLSPLLLESFERIDQALTRRREWPRLAENYRRMLARVPAERRDLRLMLWHALGEIFRSRLGDVSQATSAFEEAQRLDPENPIRGRILQELYERDPARWDAAAAVQRARLQEAVTPNHLRALFQTFQRGQQSAASYWAAASLRALGGATQEEEALAVQGRFVHGNGLPGAALAARWSRVWPAEEGSALVSELFGLVAPALCSLVVRTERDLGLSKQERLPPGAAHPAAQLISSLAEALGVPRPAIYLATPAEGAVETGLSLSWLGAEVAVVVSPAVQQIQRDRDLTFVIARHVFYLRPELLLIRLAGVNQPLLRSWVRALMSLAAPARIQVQGEELSWAKRLQPLLPAAQLAPLAELVERAFQRGQDPSTTFWLSYAERAANRFALLAAGDLDAAARVLGSDTTPLSVLSARAKLYDLLRFAVSAEHLAAREAAR